MPIYIFEYYWYKGIHLFKFYFYVYFAIILFVNYKKSSVQLFEFEKSYFHILNLIQKHF